MTLKQVLGKAREIFTAHNIDDSTLECQLLLRHTLGINTVQMYLDLDSFLEPD